MADFTKVFAQEGIFAACRAAEAWLEERGFSIGRMQGPAPRALMYGDYDIQKWRNLSEADRTINDGVMIGNMRHGPITVTIYERGRGFAAIARATGDE